MRLGSVIILIAVCLAAGCAAFNRGRIVGPGGASVVGVADAGKPATLNTEETKSGIAIPANTPVAVVRYAATPATDKTPYVPAHDEIKFVPVFDTRLESVSAKLSADTGTVDTSIALRKIQAAENRYLLFAAIGAAALAAFFVYIQYPTPAMMAGGAALVFFAAWKLADLPSWFWVIGVGATIAGVVMWRAHERGLKTLEVGKPIETVIPKTP